MKKKLFNLLCMLLICLLAVAALTVIVTRVQNRILFVGGKASVWVMTGSMEETIPSRSYILIEKLHDPASEVQQGDVITFYSTDPAISGQLNTHRVMEIDPVNRQFVTKGDHNPVEDSAPVPYENVVGRYVRRLPFLSTVGRFLMTTVGFVLTMTVLLVLICAVYLPDVIRAIQSGSEPKELPAAAALSDSELERRIADEVERLKQAEKIHPDSEGEEPCSKK